MQTDTLKILIVDDNPKNIQIVGNILANEKVQIAYATEGKRAIELCSINDFDLILLDIMMPQMDGFEVCLYLRNQEKTKETPIIFLTAKSDSESIIKGFELGANDYLTKPFNSAELKARVKTNLELSLKRKQLGALNQNLEIKVTERTLQLENANKQLKSLEKAKSEFLSIISHELRTPLSNMIGLTSLLDQTELTKEQNEYVIALMQVAKQLARFSETALLITSLHSRNEIVEMYPVLLKTIIEIGVDELQFKKDEKQIEITQEYEDEHIQAFVDSDLIRRCIMILIENGINHLPVGGKIFIKTFAAENNTVCVQISDDSKGVSSELLTKINEFLREEKNYVNNGINLTLVAVKLIMDAHGGRLVFGHTSEGGVLAHLTFINNKQL
ncbi:MAG: hybrid sensor histidine kinase/response regulator [Ignavibacteria bacterium]|nr:hybrid sensor histidine kinase/response regulator [Ignavibacteria bacterium]